MKKDIDATAVNRSLKKIAKGGGLIFAGTLFGMALQMMNRVLIVRSLSRADYGIFSLGLVLFSMAGTLSQSGFSLSVPRFLGYYRGKGDEPHIKGVIRASFELGLILAGVLTLILISGAQYIGTFYQMEGLTSVLRIFAMGIPLINFMHIITNIFRGFDNAKPTLYFNTMVAGILRFLLLLTVVVTAPSLLYIVAAYVAALAVTALSAASYYTRNSPVLPGGDSSSMRKELLFFSIPLFGTVFLGQFMKWTDVLMLGYFTSADLVGLYNGALPLCVLIPIFLNSAGFIFVPVLSVLYSQGQLSEMKKTYSIITKWTFSASLPLFLVIFIFSGTVLTFLFGTDYYEASTALRILSVGYMFHVSLGPIGQNLVIFGRPRLIMVNNTAGLIINVLLNIVLIPRYGINGAAVATAVTYVSLNCLALIQVYRISRMHPFSRNYIKLVGSSLCLLIGFFTLFTHFTVPYWMLPLVLVLISVSYGLVALVTRSFDREDALLLRTLEKRTGIKVGWLKRTLRRLIG
jgi:O-antigen/teichoic acid export membrane protein